MHPFATIGGMLSVMIPWEILYAPVIRADAEAPTPGRALPGLVMREDWRETASFSMPSKGENIIRGKTVKANNLSKLVKYFCHRKLGKIHK
jgi:hypothetical protein